jgi:hypothetical protein
VSRVAYRGQPNDTNHNLRSIPFDSSFDSRVVLVAHQGGLKCFGLSLVQKSNIHRQTCITTRMTGYTLDAVYSDSDTIGYLVVLSSAGRK